MGVQRDWAVAMGSREMEVQKWGTERWDAEVKDKEMGVREVGVQEDEVTYMGPEGWGPKM